MAYLSESAKVEIDSLLADVVESKLIPGVSFAATNLNEEIYFGKAGIRVLNHPEEGPIDENSIFWICSHTKLVTSLAGLQLVEQGKITMDTVVSDILPELANPVIVDDPFANKMTYKPAQTTITFWHLLNHSSGLFYDVKRNPSHALPSAYTDPHVGENLIKEWYNKIKKDLPGMPLKFEPGTDFAYGYNVDSIGFIVERLTGKTLEQYCRENIFLPLGMTNTSFFMTPEMKERSVSLSFRNSDGTLSPLIDQVPVSQQRSGQVRMHLGGVGLESTLKDYLSLLRHLLQIHAGNAKNPILSTETVHNLFKPTLTEKGVQSLNEFVDVTDGQWGMGLRLNTTDWPGMRKKLSGCWYGWAGTYYFIDPTTGIAAMLGSQVIPTRDKEVEKLWQQAEAALYAGLVGGQKPVPVLK